MKITIETGDEFDGRLLETIAAIEARRSEHQAHSQEMLYDRILTFTRPFLEAIMQAKTTRDQ